MDCCIVSFDCDGAKQVGSEPLAVSSARLAVSLGQTIGSFVQASDQNLGHVETQMAQQAQELLRQATELAAQQKADATPPHCPVCGQALSRCRAGQARAFQTRFGLIKIRRTRGYCQRCRKWRYPADAVLGLEETAGYSPAVQEMAALMVTKMPVAEASLVLERLTSVKLPRATLDREAPPPGPTGAGFARPTGQPTGYRPTAQADGAKEPKTLPNDHPDRHLEHSRTR